MNQGHIFKCKKILCKFPSDIQTLFLGITDDTREEMSFIWVTTLIMCRCHFANHMNLLYKCHAIRINSTRSIISTLVSQQRIVSFTLPLLFLLIKLFSTIFILPLILSVPSQITFYKLRFPCMTYFTLQLLHPATAPSEKSDISYKERTRSQTFVTEIKACLCARERNFIWIGCFTADGVSAIFWWLHLFAFWQREEE